jgi:D-threo-aldose 1-dehydrogenase
MKVNQIGRCGVTVTALGFGGAPIGNLYHATTENEAAAAVEAAWNGGIRYFDTAPHYGLGLSERRLGASLSQHVRGDYVISTKVGRLLTPNPRPTGSDLESGGFDVSDDLIRTLDYSGDGVKRSIEQSLQRLNTDYLDIVYVHDPDDHVEQVISETFPALVKLREEGVVRAIGAGMNYWQPLMSFVTTSDIDVVMLAGRWTLLDRSGEPLLRECASRKVAVVAAAPFNSGLLASAHPTGGTHFNYQSVSQDLLARAKVLAARCEKYGVSLPEAAINFPLRSECVVAVVAGFRRKDQAQAGAEWMNKEIPEELWDELESLNDTVVLL